MYVTVVTGLTDVTGVMFVTCVADVTNVTIITPDVTGSTIVKRPHRRHDLIGVACVTVTMVVTNFKASQASRLQWQLLTLIASGSLLTLHRNRRYDRYRNYITIVTGVRNVIDITASTVQR
jgi:hypothetical protein